ncbi:hypothetical protein [Bianquea renquensis]|jgi:hypothetical protein|uniref:Uncharacterized protein n=1 Tax=Bianquea renquensis TaxID=2763661 RepID=A0A926DPW7_9FIRM|nr:hypothetical protein [Bianquea renquensis]MBC8542341.1 hypothetical protein [Bianquea renquensis]
MSCFLVTAAEAVITTVAAKVIQSREKEPETIKLDTEGGNEIVRKVPLSRKLRWLSHLLWGGSALLAFEHVWHGEVVPWFPFLTAASNPADAAEMLNEMATTGVAMAVLVTVIWLGMLAVTSAMEKKILQAQSSLK